MHRWLWRKIKQFRWLGPICHFFPSYLEVFLIVETEVDINDAEWFVVHHHRLRIQDVLKTRVLRSVA